MGENRWDRVPDTAAARAYLEGLACDDCPWQMVDAALDEIDRLRAEDQVPVLERLARAAHVLAVPEGSLVVVPLEMVPDDDDEWGELAGEWGKAIMGASGHQRFLIVAGDVTVLGPEEAREALQALAAYPVRVEEDGRIHGYVARKPAEALDRATVERVVAGVIDWTEAADIGTKRAAAELTAELMAAFTTAGLVAGDG